MKFAGMAVAFSSLFLLSACANTSSQDANLSPAERVLRSHGTNTALTTGEGAILVGGIGCGLGYLAGGLKGCLAGGISGGVVGGAAGYYIATRAEAAKLTEDQYAKQIVQANKEAEDEQRVADASQAIADEATQNINALKVQLRNQQITVAQYNEQLSKYQEDSKLLAANIANTQKKIETTNNLISVQRGTPEQRQELVKVKQKLQLALQQEQRQSESLSGLVRMS